MILIFILIFGIIATSIREIRPIGIAALLILGALIVWANIHSRSEEYKRYISSEKYRFEKFVRDIDRGVTYKYGLFLCPRCGASKGDIKMITLFSEIKPIHHNGLVEGEKLYCSKCKYTWVDQDIP